ncbi:zinc finger MYM-type protein 1-like protein [Tanacetum coccineum]
MMESESHVVSVKSIKFQLSDIREGLIHVSQKDIQSQAKSLSTNELSDFEFILAVLTWFDILHRVNLVSKMLQYNDMLINVAMTEVQDLISFFKEFRVNGFSNAVGVAKKIALKIDINPLFIQKRVIHRKRQFDETFAKEDLKFYDDYHLKSCCSRLEATLKNFDPSDINANELYVELRKNLLKTKIDKALVAVNITWFSNAIDIAKKIALKMEINPLFIQKRVIHRKRQFDEASAERSTIALPLADICIGTWFQVKCIGTLALWAGYGRMALAF